MSNILPGVLDMQKYICDDSKYLSDVDKHVVLDIIYKREPKSIIECIDGSRVLLKNLSCETIKEIYCFIKSANMPKNINYLK